jgi:glutamine synthetase
MSLGLDELRQLAKAGEIDTVIVADTDMQGRLFGKRLTASHFLAHATTGISTCSVVLGWGQDHSLDNGYSLTGWDTGFADFTSVPDLATFRRYAWFPRTAIVLCDARSPGGAPISVSPRQILRSQLQKAEQIGLAPFVASELELFLLKETPDSAEAKGYVNLEPKHRTLHPETVIRTSEDEDYAADLRAALEASDVPVELVKAEYSPGQIEVNLGYAPALEAADRHVLMKTACKELALRKGLIATFMAKWHHSFGGSSCHVHMSMRRPDGRSVFDQGDGRMSATLRHFIGGLITHARDFFLFYAPTTNSYKRLVPNTFAPSRLHWGIDNRTVAFRVIGNGLAKRVENRVPGADVNPYLVYAAMLASGLDGVRNEIEPPEDGLMGNAYADAGGIPIPRDLAEATELFASSEIVAATLGSDAQAHYANFGRQTGAALARKVTDAERRVLLLDI